MKETGSRIVAAKPCASTFVSSAAAEPCWASSRLATFWRPTPPPFAVGRRGSGESGAARSSTVRTS